MVFKELSVTVDVKEFTKNPVYTVSTSDWQSLKFLVTVQNNGNSIDLTDITPRIAIKKPDNTKVLQDGEVTDPINGKCEFALVSQAYVVGGVYKAEVMLYKGTEQVATTSGWTYMVSIGVMNINLESENDFPALSKAIVAGENESVRISAENTREASESIRQSNETTRESNESLRKTNETARQNNTAVAIDAANTAATEANTARDNANAAANTANVAASNADAKAAELENRVENAIAETTDSAEIVDARGGHTVLRDRLESIESQMAQKPNIALVESGLNRKRDVTVKIEPEDASDRLLALVTGEGTINLESIPQANSVDATKLEPSLRDGLTFPVVNLLENGDFPVQHNWSFSSHFTGSGFSLSSTEDSFVGERSAKGVINGASVNAQCRNNNAYEWIDGHKYFVSAYIKPKHNTLTRIEIGNGNEVSTNYLEIEELIPGQWNKVFGVIEYTKTSAAPNRFAVNHSTSNPYVNGDVVFFDGFLAIDLTSVYGKDEEPTALEVESMLGILNWFEGERRFPLPTRQSMKVDKLEKQVQTGLQGLNLSVNNLITNGDFEITTPPWSFSSHLLGSGYSLSSTEDNLTGDRAAKGVIASNSEFAMIFTNDSYSWVNGRKYYLLGHIKPKHSTKTSIGIGNRDEAPSNYWEVDTLIPNQWNKVSGVIEYTPTSLNPNRFAITHDTRPYTIDEILYFDSFLAIDLTATFGSGFEPEKEEMDTLMDKTLNKVFPSIETASQGAYISVLDYFSVKLKYLQAQIDAIVGGVVN